jgi:hypothetical protein
VQKKRSQSICFNANLAVKSLADCILRPPYIQSVECKCAHGFLPHKKHLALRVQKIQEQNFIEKLDHPAKLQFIYHELEQEVPDCSDQEKLKQTNKQTNKLIYN